jgi:hypothetical protein
MSTLESLNFNAAQVEPSTGFDPLPEGSYLVMVAKAEEKPTKSGAGVQLVMELRVLDGKYAKRTLFHRINLTNPNTTCVQIGRAELSAVCRALGVMTPKAAFEFCNRQARVSVKIAQRSDGKGLTNEIHKWEAVAAVAGLVQDGSSKISQPEKAQTAAAPWAK